MAFENLEEKEAVKRAAQMEENGFAFYTLLSDRTDDNEVKSVFKRLAHDEKRHLKALEQIFFPRAGLGDQITEEELEIESYVKGDGVPDVFFRKIDVEKLVDSIDGLRGALMFALAIERHSVDFFNDLASKAETVDGRKMYVWLAEEEKTHVKQLEKLLEDL